MLFLSGKIPVYINPFFWLLAILLGWINSMNVTGTAIWVVVILISVLVHEFGHALTAVYFGQRAKIELMAFGGATYRSGGRLKLWKEFLIVLNGPLFGLLLFACAFFFKKAFVTNQHNLFVYALNITILVNLFWTIVNLLPVQPLDGGQLLRIFLEGIFGFRGIKIAFFLSMLLSAAFSLLFIVSQLLLLGMIFLLFTFESYRMWKSTLELTEKDQDEELQELLKQAEVELRTGRFEEATEKLHRLRDLSKEGALHVVATEHLGKILSQKGLDKQAFELLHPLKKKIQLDSLKLLQNISYRIGKWQDAIDLGNNIYQIEPSYQTALTNALSHAILGEAKPACGWLNSAIKDGLPDVPDVLSKREFDNIRDDQTFQMLLGRND